MVLATGGILHAQAEGQYRDFHLGATLVSITTLTGAPMSSATTLHQRPAVLQALQWTPGSSTTAASGSLGAALQTIVFSFYNDQLSRLMIDYDRSRTEAMTDDDMIAALTTIYGLPSTTSGKDAVDRDYESVASRRVARWTTPDYSVTLSRWAYGTAFRLVVESTRLTTLANTAEARALVLDAEETPYRDATRGRREDQDRQAARDKTRSANKATFQP